MPSTESKIVRRIVTIFVSILCIVLLGYAAIIVIAELGLGGRAPHPQVVGTFDSFVQASSYGRCSGLIVTPKGTWLVGGLDKEPTKAELTVPSSATLLEHLPDGTVLKDLASDILQNSGVSILREGITLISRLDAHKHFQIVAAAPGTACLYPTPDGATLFVSTGLQYHPKGTKKGDTENAFFRSDDQGKHWSLMPDGWFHNSGFGAQLQSTQFIDNQRVWATGNRIAPSVQFRSTFGIYYSFDQGRSVLPAVSDVLLQGLWTDKPPTSDEMDAVSDTTSGTDNETSVFLAPLDEANARVWLSRKEWKPSTEDSTENSIADFNTNEANIHWDGSRWQLGTIEHVPHVFIQKAAQSPDGKVFAILSRAMSDGHKGPTTIAVLNRKTLQWDEIRKIPDPFLLLGSDGVYVEALYAGRNALVLSAGYGAEVATGMRYSSKSAAISAEATYYSLDQGHTWTKLALAQYQTPIGFDAEHDRLFWLGKDAPFQDMRIQAYDLAP